MIDSLEMFLCYCFKILIFRVNYLISTVAKEGCVCVCVSLATLSVIPRVVKPFSIGCGLATVSMIVADFHHSSTITLGIWDSARLDGNA